MTNLDSSKGKPSQNRRRVLLVEDWEFNRDMLSRRLSRYGWEVIIAVDGTEGLHRAQTIPVDVILMDLSLPDVDGWEVTRRLKSNEETRRIPIIALTAHAMQGDREKALAAGCDEFETKPVQFDSLIGKMNALAG